MPLVPLPPNIDLNRQDHEIPGTRKEGQSGVFTNAFFDRSILTAPDEPHTLFQLFEDSVKEHPDHPLFVRRALHPSSTLLEPVWTNTLIPTSYATVQSRRNNFGSALLALEREGRLRNPASEDISPPEIKHPGIPFYGDENRRKGGARRGWAVGVWSSNREEWQVMDLACQAFGLVGVSLYETLGPDVARYITNHCPLPIIVASQNHLPALLKIAPLCPSLRVIVSMDPLPTSERQLLNQWAASVGLDFFTMDELEAKGAQEPCKPGPEEGEEELDLKRICTISYTSGTTGDPKGVVLTTENVLSATISNGKGVNPSLINQPWMFLSFLPLSHIYERFAELVVMYGGGTIGFTRADPTKLLEDAQLIKPHFMIGVPRMWNRIHAAVKGQMDSGGLKGALLTKAVNTKLARWRETGEVTHPIYDALVFRKIRALLGGRLVFIASGAAPLRKDVHEMLKVVFSCEVVQGFGMTETVGTCSVGIPWDVGGPGTCGRLQPCNDVKLVDVPDMGYTAKDLPNPRGEVCLKGPNISPGYLHNHKATKESIDEDGWFHTGDIGEIDSAGRLKIVDRLKNVVKLSQGEYVALEKLEGLYALDPLFASFLVHGDSTRSSLIAIAILDPQQTSSLVSKILGKNVPSEDLRGLEEAARSKEVRKAVFKILGKTARQNKLNGFEMIKGLHLTLTPFPEDIVTPTFKIKRNIAAKIYAREIEEAYGRGEEEAAEALREARL
ncbi:long-chain acyl-CoA synthetase [Cryptococcus deuterogattii LA55]|nr:long-chain acyl-CoA synthetase [Cryptococcus deuterogattii LA55]KIR36750.1 long-chain acyl-CoA synthetase [Cryptococcus deuterogattii MMRL2647]KIR92519.1 long-chain acyl-CoA synthetase [Cryptococcus deuterogattii CBS 10090]KIS01685.1 long-chain acyl-CoA synthetase [Cryptococcus deuterogattii 2001/935-1]